MKKWRHGWRVASVVLILAAPASDSVAQIPSPGPVAQPSRQQRNPPAANPGIFSRNLIGSRVQSDRGDELGTIIDLVIDPQSGRLDYVVIASGGFFKIGRKLRPVPPNLLGTATAKRGVVKAAIDPESWKTAPVLSRASRAELSGDAGRRIYAYYHQKWTDSSARDNGTASQESRHQSGTGDPLEFATYLIGKPLLDRDARKVGRITDILLDLRNPQATFVIVGAGGEASRRSSASGDREQFAVPINALHDSAGSERLAVRVTPSQLQQAPPLNAATWKAASTSSALTIYCFQSEQPSPGQPQSPLTRQ